MIENIKEKTEQLIPFYQEELNLKYWKVDWHLEELSSGEAKCEVNPVYFRIKLSIDPNRIRDYKHLRETIIHELVHAILGSYENSANSLLDSLSPESAKLMSEVLEKELEKTVMHLEQVLLKLSSSKNE